MSTLANAPLWTPSSTVLSSWLLLFPFVKGDVSVRRTRRRNTTAVRISGGTFDTRPKPVVAVPSRLPRTTTISYCMFVDMSVFSCM